MDFNFVSQFNFKGNANETQSNSGDGPTSSLPPVPLFKLQSFNIRMNNQNEHKKKVETRMTKIEPVVVFESVCIFILSFRFRFRTHLLLGGFEFRGILVQVYAISVTQHSDSEL